MREHSVIALACCVHVRMLMHGWLFMCILRAGSMVVDMFMLGFMLHAQTNSDKREALPHVRLIGGWKALYLISVAGLFCYSDERI